MFQILSNSERNQMTNEELMALVRQYVFESTDATAPALLSQIHAEYAKRGQLFTTIKG